MITLRLIHRNEKLGGLGEEKGWEEEEGEGEEGYVGFGGHLLG